MKKLGIPLAALIATGAALAQSSGQPLTGGVGLEERERMMQRYGDYTMHLGFAEVGGPYVADVAVTVQDESGKVVLSSVADGPFLFAKLPPGSYRVTADFGGRAQTRTIRVGTHAGPIHYFRWGGGSEASVSAGPR